MKLFIYSTLGLSLYSQLILAIDFNIYQKDFTKDADFQPRLVKVQAEGKTEEALTDWGVNEDGIWDPGDLTGQTERDKKLILRTLFPDNIDTVGFTPKQIESEKLKINVIRRIILALAYFKLKYTTQAQPETKDGIQAYLDSFMPWDKSLAIAITHGQRILFLLDGISSEEFADILLGKEGKLKKSDIWESRTFASHSTSKLGDLVIEEKGVKVGDHQFINYPFGGLGDYNPRLHIIGPEGKSYDQTAAGKLKKVDGLQHGHLYFYMGSNKSVLMGFETSEGGYANDFGLEHTAGSAGRGAATGNPSLSGGQKMKLLLAGAAPNEDGGMRVWITAADAERFKDISKLILEKSTEEQKEDFIKILNAENVEDIRVR